MDDFINEEENISKSKYLGIYMLFVAIWEKLTNKHISHWPQGRGDARSENNKIKFNIYKTTLHQTNEDKKIYFFKDIRCWDIALGSLLTNENYWVFLRHMGSHLCFLKMFEGMFLIKSPTGYIWTTKAGLS